jgi:hypothetical protein
MRRIVGIGGCVNGELNGLPSVTCTGKPVAFMRASSMAADRHKLTSLLGAKVPNGCAHVDWAVPPCVFCRSRSADSKEHAWPEWLLNALGEGPATVRSERSGEPAKEWRGVKAGVKVKCVCAKCNNEWMSALEVEAKPFLLPLILGKQAELSGAQQLAIATWSLKTAMVFDCTRTTKDWFFSQEERSGLYDARTGVGLGTPFPPHTFVWLAAYRGQNTATSSASVLRGIADVGPNRERQVPIEGHVSTIAAGVFVVQVLTTRLPPTEPNREPILHSSGAMWDRSTVRVWPGVARLAGWPPATVLDDETLQDFETRWPLTTTRIRR